MLTARALLVVGVLVSTACQSTTTPSGTDNQANWQAPAACSAAAGPAHPFDRAELERLLPGTWLACQPTMANAFWPADVIGIGIDANATHWRFLVDDGHGNPVLRVGFAEGGIVNLFDPDIGPMGAPGAELRIDGSSTIPLQPTFSDGPPLRMMDGISTYVLGPSIDVEAAPAPPDGSTAPFGGACDPNYVRLSSCPPVGDVACSICASVTTGELCVQPCHLATNDCPAPQSCTKLVEYMLTGDCTDFDGYCE
jgi:hypothetical protein